MTGNNALYPASPTNVPKSVTQVSASFKKEVTGVMGTIILFFIVYLVMFLLSIGLIVACVYAGFRIITTVPNLFMVLVGAGLIGLGIMVFIFLIKFLFAGTKYDRSGSIRITEEEQPILFEFVRNLTKDVETAFPKNIYLSPDVNAAVFYNSSFWSMFFPIRKNLQIGLGLVNSLNVSEFKAVMAHEFGHFSQRSMRLGSFVYNVNKIIHNMLFENTGYAGFLQGWANIHGVFAVFAQLTARFAGAIQWVLRQMYAVVNRSYMRLSREMEFHADAVAASISGSNSLATALRRIEVANEGFNIALQKCDELLKQKKISANIYLNQKTVLKQLAGDFKLATEHDIPIVSEEFLAENNSSRVNYKDQWASHPATNDRVEQLKRLAVVAETINEPAWNLFTNQEQLQAQLTQKIYEKTAQDGEAKLISNQEFEEKLNADLEHFSFPAAYNGFYDNRQVPLMNIKEMGRSAEKNSFSFDEIFSDKNASLRKKIVGTAGDIEVLKAISEKKVKTKTFDFDGVKYKSREAPAVISTLEKELQTQKSQLEETDKQAVLFFLGKAAQKDPAEASRLEEAYIQFFEYRSKSEEFLKRVNDMLASLAPIFSGQAIPVQRIRVIIDDLKSDHEAALKDWLRQWQSVGAFEQNPELKSKVEKFINSRHAYFGASGFFDTELIALNEICNESWNEVNIFIFGQFKSILQQQLALMAN